MNEKCYFGQEAKTKNTRVKAKQREKRGHECKWMP